MAEVTLKIGEEVCRVEAGTRCEEIAKRYQKDHDARFALVLENGKIRELNRAAKKDAELKFITLKQSSGHKSYVRTAILIMVKAIDDVCGHDKSRQVKVEFAIGNGYYISPKGGLKADADFLTKVEARMHELVDAGLEIKKSSMPTDEARKMFAANEMHDKERLFRFRRSSSVNVYDLDGYKDYYYGYMLPNTAYVRDFALETYEDGFMLVLPTAEKPEELEAFVPRKKLFGALKTADDWGNKLGVDTVGDLNERICQGGIGDLILLQEALQERKIAEIARDIVERGGVKFVMIAGPSSSGKTTFSHRMSVQLASYGLRPHPIAVDDYFKNRVDTPKNPDGSYNFECLEAIDVELFNNDMVALLEGKTVEIPSFNFVNGRREY